jgi:AraC family transcriptional regulator
MPEEKRLSVHFTRKDANLPVLPYSPIIWSKKALEDGIRVEHQLHPVRGTSDCCLPYYTISVHVGRPIRLKQVANGRPMCDRIGYGDIIVSPPYLHRRLLWDNPAELILLYLEPKLFVSAVGEVVDADRIEIVPQFKLRDPLIQQILLALKSEHASGELVSHLYAESMATALSVHLLDKYSAFTPRLPDNSTGLPKHRLQSAIEYINDNLDKDLKLAEIADQVGMSQYYFARLFKQSMGLPVYQYVLQCRVERAKQLLKQSELPIADIALAVGFTDHSQFTRHFKRIIGTTPREIRKQ